MTTFSKKDEALIKLGAEFQNLLNLKHTLELADEEYGQALDAFEERYGNKKRERLEVLLEIMG